MSVQLSDAIRYTSIISALAPMLIYITVLIYLTFKKVPQFVHCIAMLCFVTFLFDLALAKLYSEGIHNIVLFNAYDPVLFIFMCWFYYNVMFKNKFKIYLKGGISLYVLFYTIVIIFFQDIGEYHNFVWASQSLIVLVFAIIYSKHLLINSLEPPSQISSRLWLNGANLFYFSFSFWLFVMANVLLVEMERDTARTVWMFHNANNIIKNIFFAIGIYASMNPEEREYNIFDKQV